MVDYSWRDDIFHRENTENWSNIIPENYHFRSSWAILRTSRRLTLNLRFFATTYFYREMYIKDAEFEEQSKMLPSTIIIRKKSIMT